MHNCLPTDELMHCNTAHVTEGLHLGTGGRQLKSGLPLLQLPILQQFPKGILRHSTKPVAVCGRAGIGTSTEGFSTRKCQHVL